MRNGIPVHDQHRVNWKSTGNTQKRKLYTVGVNKTLMQSPVQYCCGTAAILFRYCYGTVTVRLRYSLVRFGSVRDCHSLRIYTHMRGLVAVVVEPRVHCEK